MKILFFFAFIFYCTHECAITHNEFIEKNILDKFEIIESTDQHIICKLHTKCTSENIISAKNLAIKISLIESIKKTATEIFFQNNSEYTDSIKETEFDPMLKAIKSFKIESENMSQNNTYEADFVITIDKKILSINSFKLLQEYLKNSNNTGTHQENNRNANAQHGEVHQISSSDININDNSINVVYRNKNAISKWLYKIKNTLDKANIKYNLKEMAANELKIEIIAENMNDTIKYLQSIGFSITKENDTLILTEIGI